MKVEHVQPVQPLSPNRGAGLRTWLAVALPAVVLVTVVIGGLLGQAGSPPSPAIAASSPLSSPTSVREPDRELAAIDAYEAVGFPPDVIGLTVRSVDETLERLRDGRMRQKVVAVAGWLTVLPPRADCRDEYDRGTGPTTLCRRETILLGSPEPYLGIDGGEVRRLRSPGSHLHPAAMAGVSLGALAGRQYRGERAALQPVPVVIVARLDDPRLPDCRPWDRGCESLSLERLVWTDGEWHGRRALRTTRPAEPAEPAELAEPAEEVRRDRIDDAIRGAGTVLSEILLPRDALAGIDAGADDAVAASVDGPVWYVRVLIRVLGPGGYYPRGIAWAVIDDATGSLVAAHPALMATAGSP